MASVFKRNLRSGEVWIIKVRLKSGEWKQYNSKITATPGNKRKALAAANRIQGVIDAGGNPFEERVGRGVPLADARGDFLKHCQRLWAASTFARYVQDDAALL